MPTVTIGGGQSISVADPVAAQTLQDAIHFAAIATPGGIASFDTAASDVLGNRSIYDVVESTDNGNDVLQGVGAVEGVVDFGAGSDTIYAGAQTSFVIGNDGDNKITAVGSKTIYDGAGNDTIVLKSAGGVSAEDTVILGAGDNRVNIADLGVDSVSIIGGAGAVAGFAADLDVSRDANLTVRSGSSITTHGNDTITLFGTSGSVTVADGSATVYGTGSNFSFMAESGTDSVVAGSGNATLFGGSGLDYFKGGTGANYMEAGTGKTFMYSGSGSDTFVGGSNLDTIYGGGAPGRTGGAGDMFEFDSDNAGGVHRIIGFRQGTDKLHFGGTYTNAEALAQAKYNASTGNMNIKLDDGTSIVLKGISHLSASDFG